MMPRSQRGAPTLQWPEPPTAGTTRAAGQSPSRFVAVQVLARAAAARDAVTFWLAAPGTASAPAPYAPGQFITLAFAPTDAGASAAPRAFYRSYSLCGDGDPTKPWEITVKRQQAGLVSTYLYEHAAPGTMLYASGPSGTFTLPRTLSPEQALVFIAAGSGITPLYGMLRALARMTPARRPRVHLHYAYRASDDAIYGNALATLDPQQRWLRQWHYRSARGQRLSPPQVLTALSQCDIPPRATLWYVCGPDALKRTMASAIEHAGIPAERIHAEIFASPRTAPAAPATHAGGPAAARIRVAETGARLDVAPGETLLEAVERYGYQPQFSCRAGSCGTCRLRLLAGQVRQSGGDAHRVLSQREQAAGYVLSCVSQPIGEVTLSLAGVPAPALAAGAAPRGSGLPAGSRGGARGGRAAAHLARSRAATLRRLRWGVSMAATALFATAWGLTSHRITASAATSTSSSSVSSSVPASGDDGNATNSSAAPAQSSSGSSSIATQPSTGISNTSTGVS